ncbi:MAG TPA: nucleoside phosphorylase [Candidatus Dormibacteraeota bacterium]|nr:nucleoside phosphorylase [Candidatus Dormibacteraeota bacterium]
MTRLTLPAATYPAFPEKVGEEGIVAPAEMLAHRRRGGRLPQIAPPRGAVICLERGLPEQMRRSVRVRQVGRLLGDLYSVRAHGDRVLVLANFGLGAPAVAAQAEELIAMGARRLVSVALCGGLQHDLLPGDVVVPDLAIRDEGTSHHYLPPSRDVAADPDLALALRRTLAGLGVTTRSGAVWSTDAPYRETPAEVRALQAEGVLGVDMELAALLAVARRRGVQAAGVLVAGDNLAGGEWQPPVRLDEMRRSLQHAYRAAVEAVDVD